MSELAGQVVIVTGAAQGIGAGIARCLAGHGAKVLIADRQADKAEALANEIDGGFVETDLTSKDAAQSLVAAAVERYNQLDTIVNNAAPGRDRTMIGNLAGADWDAHADLVLKPVMALADAALPYLAKSANGAIVNISSVTATTVMPEHCSWAYHVSKAGLEQMTRYLAVALGPKGVRVNTVAPVLVDRDEGRKLSDDETAKSVIEATAPLGRAGSARDIGEAVAFLASGRASYITGQVLTVDGGIGAREVFGAGLAVVQTDTVNN